MTSKIEDIATSFMEKANEAGNLENLAIPNEKFTRNFQVQVEPFNINFSCTMYENIDNFDTEFFLCSDILICQYKGNLFVLVTFFIHFSCILKDKNILGKFL